jgi:Asp-tRNA(Asn)/Glu-tRNA(Gln) amidotransferase A subunit family amidase
MALLSLLTSASRRLLLKATTFCCRLASASLLPAIAGYPHLTVPMGEVSGLPVGLSFIGTAWSEQALLALGYSFEQARPESP